MGRNRASYSRSRTRRTIEPNPYFLIVCEGEVTEYDYFCDFPYSQKFRDKDRLGNKRGLVRIINKAGQRFSVVTKAKQEFDKLNKDYNIEPSNVWCVFDRDYNSTEEDNDFCKAIQHANKLGFNPIYSIQCFEIWYILHYQLLSSAIDRNHYNRIITRNINVKYDHGTIGMYDRLIDRQQIAIKNAQKLLQENKEKIDCKQFKRIDPFTNVDKLVIGLNTAYDNLR